MVAWHWRTGSWLWRSTGALDPIGFVTLDQCGGVKLDPGGAALRKPMYLYSSGGMALYFSYCIVMNPVLNRGGGIAGGTGALVSL